jgi:hypothetical protein
MLKLNCRHVLSRKLQYKVKIEKHLLRAFGNDDCRHFSKWAGMYRYTIPEIIFVPEFHTDNI